LELNRCIPDLLTRLTEDHQRSNRTLAKLAKIVSDIAKDSVICQAIEELHWRALVFDRLRKAMRIALVDGDNGLNYDGTSKAMTSIRKGVEQFRHELEIDPKLVNDQLCRKMAMQIDKYRDNLFADPIEVETLNGIVTIYPQRTNNIMEQFFRGVRSGHRRKSGNDSMSRTLQTMLADTPLVKNLDNQEYVKILLNGKTNLEELFAEVALIPSSKADKTEEETERILPGFKKIIKSQNLPDQVKQLLTKPIK
jgi:hypothetical protein